MRYLFLVLFLIACGSYDSPADELPELEKIIEIDSCKQNPEIKKTEIKEICSNSVRCSTAGEISLTNYMCFCSNICICFFSILSDCESMYDETCEKDGSIMFLSKDFCLSVDKIKFLKDFNKKTH